MATTYDVRAVQADGSEVLFDHAGGAVVTGYVKLGQRVLVELFTRKASVAYLPFRGTTFLDALDVSHSTELDVHTAFAAALNDLKTNLQREESVSDPAEERFQTAEIDSVIISPGAVQIVLVVFALSGGTSRLTLPTVVLNG